MLALRVVQTAAEIVYSRSVSRTRRSVSRDWESSASDYDLVVFLEGAGIAEPEGILGDPQWVEWRDGSAHEFSAA